MVSSTAGRGRLTGRVALVTGAAAGIGRATAELFSAEGAQLVLLDVQAERLGALEAELTGRGAVAHAVVGSVASERDVERSVLSAVERFGRLDVLVANAGIARVTRLQDASAEDWDEMMAVDARGMFLSCKHAVGAMTAGGGGAVVCLSSISGLAGQAGQSTYGPAKFVASGLTKHLAVELADRGIRVNAVAPGTINTDMVRGLPDEPGGQEKMETLLRLHPMGRFGEPEEVARAILFLASDEASFVTGAILPVDGGYLAQ